MARSGCRLATILVVCLVLTSGASAQLGAQSMLDLLLSSSLSSTLGKGSPSPAPAEAAPSPPPADAGLDASSVTALGGATPTAGTEEVSGQSTPSTGSDASLSTTPTGSELDSPSSSSSPTGSELPTGSVSPTTTIPSTSELPTPSTGSELPSTPSTGSELPGVTFLSPSPSLPSTNSELLPSSPSSTGSELPPIVSSSPASSPSPSSSGIPSSVAPITIDLTSPTPTTTTPAPAVTTTTPAPATTTTPAPASSGSSSDGSAPADSPASVAPAPGSPPASWMSLKPNTAMVFELELKGKYVTPWTQPKSYVVAKTLQANYLRAVRLSDISINMVSTFTYLSYDNGYEQSAAAQGGARRLLQTEKAGVVLKGVVETNDARIESEMESLVNAVNSGDMAAVLADNGMPVEGVALTSGPRQMDLDKVNESEDSGSGGLAGWAIGLIVAAILLIIPGPLYCLIKVHKRKRKEAIARREAEVAAARARAQSRVKPKSFSLSPGAHHIMVRTGGLPSAPGSLHNGYSGRMNGSTTRSLQSQNSLGAASVRSGYTVRSSYTTRSMRVPHGGMPGGAPGVPGSQSFSRPGSSPALDRSGLVREDSMQHTSRGSRHHSRANSLTQQQFSPPPPNAVVEIYPQDGADETMSTRSSRPGRERSFS